MKILTERLKIRSLHDLIKPRSVGNCNTTCSKDFSRCKSLEDFAKGKHIVRDVGCCSADKRYKPF